MKRKPTEHSLTSGPVLRVHVRQPAGLPNITLTEILLLFLYLRWGHLSPRVDLTCHSKGTRPSEKLDSNLDSVVLESRAHPSELTTFSCFLHSSYSASEASDPTTQAAPAGHLLKVRDSARSSWPEGTWEW